jgi:hypothetical protein
VARRYDSSRTLHGTARLEVKHCTGSSEEAWAPATALGAAALDGTAQTVEERTTTAKQRSLAKARGEMGDGEEQGLLASTWRVAGMRPAKGRCTWVESDVSKLWRRFDGDNGTERLVGCFRRWCTLCRSASRPHGRVGHIVPSGPTYSGFNYFFSISKLRTTCKLQKQSFLASKNFHTLHGDNLLQNGQLSFLAQLPNPSEI